MTKMAVYCVTRLKPATIGGKERERVYANDSLGDDAEFGISEVELITPPGTYGVGDIITVSVIPETAKRFIQ